MTAENLSDHFGELTLRRLRAGELTEPESTRARTHLEDCAPCKARWRALQDEQRRFEQELPFERFAAGVTRAARRPAPGLARRVLPLAPLVAVAAAVLLAVFTRPDAGDAGRNRLKGGLKGTAEVALRIAAPAGGPQRDATPGAAEVLAPGERVRIGYKPGGHRYVASISIDERGEVSPLYPDDGRSLEIEGGGEGMQYLPGALEFYGRGAERVIVVLSDGPLDLDELRAAARAAYDDARGDVVRMGELPLRATGVEQFHQTLLKP